MFGLSMIKGKFGALHKNLDPGTSEFRLPVTVDGGEELHLSAVAAVRVAPDGDESTGPFEERWALFKSNGGLPGKAVPWPTGHPPLSDTSIESATTLFRWSWSKKKEEQDSSYDGEAGTYKTKLHEGPVDSLEADKDFIESVWTQVKHRLDVADDDEQMFRAAFQFTTGTWSPYFLLTIEGKLYRHSKVAEPFEAEGTFNGQASKAVFEIVSGDGKDTIAKVYREHRLKNGLVTVHQVAVPGGLPRDTNGDGWLRFKPAAAMTREAFLQYALDQQQTYGWLYSRGTTKLYTYPDP